MKKAFFFFSIIITSFTCISQDYTVVHVTGKIILPSTQAELKAGSNLKQEDVLSYPGQNAWTVIINTTTGQQYFLQQQASADTAKSVGQSIQFIEKTNYPVTRSSRKPVENLRSYFAGRQFVFIGDNFYLEVDSNNYPLDDKLFLLYRYEYNTRIITHKIPQDKNVIHFNKPFLYEYKGDSISYLKTSNTELSYFNSNTNLPAYAAGFRPIWLDETELRKELQVLQAVYSHLKKSRNEIKKLLLQYVLDVYGKTDEVIFMEWLDQKVNK
jgi:hypothetical protein